LGSGLCCSGGTADTALSFPGADDCPATAAHRWPAGVSLVLSNTD
jgi:hypothetical protein